jgi:hypothetical protein
MPSLLARLRPDAVRAALPGASGVIRRLLSAAALLAAGAGAAQGAVAVPANAIAVEPVLPRSSRRPRGSPSTPRSIAATSWCRRTRPRPPAGR